MSARDARGPKEHDVGPPALLLRLGREFQRMAGLAAGVGAFGGLTFGDLAGEGGDHADAALVRGHHHAIGLVLAHVEDSHQDGDDELARRIVVVDQDHLIESRLFDLRLGDGIGFDVDIAHRPSPALLVDASSIVWRVFVALQRLRQAAACFTAALRSFTRAAKAAWRAAGSGIRRIDDGWTVTMPRCLSANSITLPRSRDSTTGRPASATAAVTPSARMSCGRTISISWRSQTRQTSTS